jgi:putative ABC transport system ATP-binding protein
MWKNLVINEILKHHIMIQLKNVTKTYSNNGQKPVYAVKSASLAIEKGEFVAIVGPSGSGKSSLMNILGMLDRPSSGEYYFENREVNTMSEDELANIRNKKIGFVFQRFHLLPKTTALENVELPLLYSDKKNIRSSAMEALSRVGLTDRATHRANELSGGQQQRVAIARALVNEPDVIFADEPTGNLDFESGQEIIKIFKTLNYNGKTIILITHDPAVAAYAKRTVTILDGLVSEKYRKETN